MQFLDRHKLTRFEFRFIVFGLPSNLKYRINLIEAVVKTFCGRTDVCFLFIGSARQDFPQLFNEFSNLIPLGQLPERDVSVLLTLGHLMLAPFPDGISTKHGTVMAAFLHHLPVLTTFGPTGDEEFLKEDIVEATSYSAELYCSAAQRLVNDTEHRKRLAEKAYFIYGSRYSFDRASNIYEKVLLSLNQNYGRNDLE